MDYEVFMSKVKKSVEALCPDCERVIITKVMKNNSLELDALVIQKKGVRISPTFYLNDYYQKYLDGMSIDAAAGEIVGIDRGNRLFQDFGDPKEYGLDAVRDNIAYRLISTRRNESLLERIPHRDFLDLSIVYYCCVDPGESDALGTVLIQNSHLSLWGIDEETLYELALANTKRLFPTVIRKLSDLLNEMFGEGEYDDPEAEDGDGSKAPMYVATNAKRIFGSACLLDYGAFDRFARENGDFYIIPSSIHELLLVPDAREADGKKLAGIVGEVNETQLEYDEILSDSVYRYDSAQHSVVKINNLNL